jgi:hypothetical protein
MPENRESESDYFPVEPLLSALCESARSASYASCNQ